MKLSYSPWFHRLAALCGWTALFTKNISQATAQVYNGGGLVQGIAAGSSVNGVTGNSLRITIGNIVNTALSYTALLAVAVIVIAGLYLILGLGNDGSKETAKKIILYTGVGIVIILLAKAIVTLFISLVG